MISGLTADAVMEPLILPRDLVVRKGGMHDIGPILDLINGYAAKGIMLPRTEFEVSEDIRDFSVIPPAGRAGRLRRPAFLYAHHRGDPFFSRR